MSPKRLRVFAGHNGSGKTTILERISKELNLGYIVSADDIEKTLNQFGSFSPNGIHSGKSELLHFEINFVNSYVYYQLTNLKQYDTHRKNR